MTAWYPTVHVSWIKMLHSQSRMKIPSTEQPPIMWMERVSRVIHGLDLQNHVLSLSIKRKKGP